MLNVGVLASGSGSNFQAIIDAVAAGRLNCQIKLLIVDNPNAYAIERAKRHSIECLYINSDEFPTEDIFSIKVAMELRARDVELVVLAGFMRIAGKLLVDAFPGKIMNIHPALLPSFPGLYSQEQAIDYSVKISGCTVHFVDEGVDTGPVIIQAAVPVSPEDTEKTLSERILKLEHKILPEAIRLYAGGRLKIKGRVVKIEGCETRNECIINPPLR
ncbi:phosphoribosylglycinamide formyltransferase [Thermodesulfovibrionales bacterium]|nr:phosphoribosylglycinamide formyltransferase [Thermodesulfovibrionales bacterium]